MENSNETPEDLLCPISSCLMTDPVRLPSSGKTIDRSTYERIILDNRCDPFNRAPLEDAKVEDDVQMRVRVQQWMADRKNREKTTELKKGLEEEKEEPKNNEEDINIDADRHFDEN